MEAFVDQVICLLLAFWRALSLGLHRFEVYTELSRSYVFSCLPLLTRAEPILRYPCLQMPSIYRVSLEQFSVAELLRVNTVFLLF